MTAAILPYVIGTLGLALLLSLYRLLRGPHAVDRVLALDTLYINTVALLIVTGIASADPNYFDAALLIAMLGFVSTVALSRFILRGDVIE